MRAACWDKNATVSALASCRAANGDVLPHCVSIAYHTSAFVVQCGGDFATDRNCGTFLELHRPGNERVINEIRLPPGFTSGYSPLHIDLSFADEPSRVVCSSDYEVGCRCCR